jgi:pimeloyl-ACP methyl ester carboxylesterase
MLEVIDKGRCTDPHPVPLLFVHGGYHAAWCWDEHFLDFFSDKGFRAVAVSLRGHGQSALSQPLRSCSIADYVEDVRSVADVFDREPVVIGHSMGGFVVQKYLEKNHAPAAILVASIPAQGTLGTIKRMLRRHPWSFLRTNVFGDPAEFINTPDRVREFFFCAHTPESVIESYATRLGSESARAGRDQVLRLPKTGVVTAPMLVLGAQDDFTVSNNEVNATAKKYHTRAEFFPDMGHNMMLEPGWPKVADRIRSWLSGHGL